MFGQVMSIWEVLLGGANALTWFESPAGVVGEWGLGDYMRGDVECPSLRESQYPPAHWWAPAQSHLHCPPGRCAPAAAELGLGRRSRSPCSGSGDHQGGDPTRDFGFGVLRADSPGGDGENPRVAVASHWLMDWR